MSITPFRIQPGKIKWSILLGGFALKPLWFTAFVLFSGWLEEYIVAKKPYRKVQKRRISFLDLNDLFYQRFGLNAYFRIENPRGHKS